MTKYIIDICSGLGGGTQADGSYNDPYDPGGGE